ncbi:MAG TPA: hypothetical protein VG225_15480 [Terracidiphilus sp.]|jgi:hypothetical protein|nr:hypothetical protein [Terracidiphilus sp.]
MIDNPNNMTCEEFQAHMPELIGSGENAAAHPHVQNCALCRALLADLETIAEAARSLFPVEDPPEHLWEQIESAIKHEEPSRR